MFVTYSEKWHLWLYQNWQISSILNVKCRQKGILLAYIHIYTPEQHDFSKNFTALMWEKSTTNWTSCISHFVEVLIRYPMHVGFSREFMSRCMYVNDKVQQNAVIVQSQHWKVDFWHILDFKATVTQLKNESKWNRLVRTWFKFSFMSMGIEHIKCFQNLFSAVVTAFNDKYFIFCKVFKEFQVQ